MTKKLLVLLAATAVLLLPDSRCLPCHAKQVKSYAATGMGRSVSGAASANTASSTFRHQFSGTTFRVLTFSNEMIHEAVRSGRRAAYEMKWAIGSGNQGKSYLHAIGDSLFQSPVSWYAQRAAFDISPGFEPDKAPDFLRPVTPDCLFCHSAQARPRPGTQNRYLDNFQPAAISCDRCHGDVRAHLTSPKKNTIVNPARLEGAVRDAVCEQCHLSGEARIPNPGKQFEDFRPGMRMEEVFSVYVREAAGDPQGLKVVSHSEQMARSKCFVQSGDKVWCGTCHDPHAEPLDKVTWYRDKCVSCHSGQNAPAHQKAVGDDCAGCHMPKLAAYDGGHTAFHDHWIRLKQTPSRSVRSTRLRAWREPAVSLQGRNLGLAYISAGSKSGDSNQLMTGSRLLGSEPSDAAVETARGLTLLQRNQTRDAVRALRRAATEAPRNSTYRYNLAVALLAAGDRQGAIQNVEAALAIEPLLEDAYVLAAEIEPHRAAYWKQLYLKLVPQRFLP